MDVCTSEKAVMTSVSNSNKDIANSYHRQMSNVKVAFAGLKQGDPGMLLQGGEVSSRPAPSGKSGQTPNTRNQPSQRAHAIVRVVRATSLLAADTGGASDPYVRVEALFSPPAGGTRHVWQHANTSVKKGTLEPEWDETLEISVFDAEVPLSLAVWDHDNIGKDFLGAAELLLTECEPGKPTVFTLALSTQGSLEVEVTFYPPGTIRPQEAAAVAATRRFAIGVYEEPKALGGLTGLKLDSGGWTALVKAELYLQDKNRATKAAEKVKRTGVAAMLELAQEFLMAALDMDSSNAANQEEDDSDDEELQQELKQAADKLEREETLSRRQQEAAQQASEQEQVELKANQRRLSENALRAYSEEGTCRQMARNARLKRVALRASASSKAQGLSSAGQSVYRTAAKMALNVQEQPLAEEQRATHIYKIYTIRTLARVPAACLIRQADGSVGFFVQRLETRQDSSALETALAALRTVPALPTYSVHERLERVKGCNPMCKRRQFSL